MGSGFSKMKKQQRLMQEQMAKMTEKMQSTDYKGVAGNGLVTVVINGEKTLKNITISKECVDPEDVEGLQDLILGAFEDASEKLAQDAESSPMASGFPGL